MYRPLRKCIADLGRTYGYIVYILRLDFGNGKVKTLRKVMQVYYVGFSISAKSVVVAHNEVLYLKPLYEYVFNVFSSRQPGEVFRERMYNQHIKTQLF